jgi:hypothetical protein
LRRWRAGGLADTDTDPRQCQCRHALRHAAQECHRAPERKRECHDVAPVEPVGEARDRDPEQRIEQHESEPREQAHRGVAEREFLFDRFDQNVEDGTVEKIQRVDHGEQRQQIVSAARRPGGSVRLRGHLRREIDHGFPLIFFLERAAASHASRM